ncbi:MAG: DEAD/DEAH box helicase domain protein [Nitrospira sp.]|jgi:superfamily II RNA helicase|nr:MAG: DEAD/DEAH box helicase domain protein [Nitrospira sp.]
MTTEELERLLLQQPVSLLHRLARGRIGRHFRSGKRKLVEQLLRATPENRPGLESDLTTLIEDQSRHRPALAEKLPPPPAQPPRASAHSAPRPHKAEEQGHHHEPPVSLHEWLSGIGVPPAQPFVPDTWQVEALAHLAETDVVVSVPTGSGKTYVAIEAATRAMRENRTVIYTSPLKALSNTKFTEFSRLFGPGQVGILTGDRRENAQASLLIMTTEILRNLLYDAAGGEIDIRLDTLGLVIMDESQYLADPERGVVWEETLIFCPSQARLLLLSASIGNPQDIADWLTAIRPTPCSLIRHTKRSVPLRAGYLHPNEKLTPLFRTAGIPYGQPHLLHPEAKRLFAEYEEETGPSRSR